MAGCRAAGCNSALSMAISHRGMLGHSMIGIRQSVQGLALAALTLLSGCGICGCMSTDDTDYGPGQRFTYNGNSWQVADRRQDGRLEITAVDPRLAGLGTEAASRHPVSGMPEAEYRAAAQGWFATTGRFCTAQSADLLEQDGYEYHYSCWEPS